MTGAQFLMLAAMGIYLIAMMGIGVRLSKKNETVGDFYLGGRKLGPLVTAMSAEASDMSSYLLMGLPGLAYLTGTADVGWTVIGLACGTYLNWLLVAKKLRRYTERTNSITLPEFFSNRYGDTKHVLTFLAAVWIIIFFVPYTASGFAACGKLFHSLFGVDYHLAMIISAIVIMFYTTSGGFLAASLTDFIQSIIMTIALLAVLGFGIWSAGGWDQVVARAQELPGYLSFTQSYNPVTGKAGTYTALTVVSTLAWGLGYFGMPHIQLRFMAIESEDKIALSRRVATVWVVISMAVAVLIGLVGHAMTEAGVIASLSGNASETVIVRISDVLSRHGILAAVTAGVVLSGILASTMSTSDSQLLAASSSVSNDILIRCLHAKIEEKKLLLISRISLLIIALVGVGIASFAWAGFGASFGPVMLLALFWRRSNRYGALAGMATGGLMIFIWKYCVRPLGGSFDIYELLPAFVLAIVVNVIVSLATPAPEEAVTKVFDEVKG